MELWIRSQDRKSLVKVNEIKFYERNGHYYIGDGFEDNYASYKSKERALEVLDEIQNKIKQRFICVVDPIYSKHSVEDLRLNLELKYPNNEFIMQPPLCELKPINTNVVIYEMPKE